MIDVSGERGVSPVVGIILVVAVSVVLSATIGAFVLNLGNEVGQSESVAGDISVRSSGSNGNTTVSVITGEADEVQVLVNGSIADRITDASPGDSVTVETSDASSLSVISVTNGEKRVISSDTASITPSGETDVTSTLVSTGFEEGYQPEFVDDSQSGVSPGTTTAHARSGNSSLNLPSHPDTDSRNSVITANNYSGDLTYTVYLKKYTDNGDENSWGIRFYDENSSARLSLHGSGYYSSAVVGAREDDESGNQVTGRMEVSSELATGEWHKIKISFVSSDTVEFTVNNQMKAMTTKQDWTNKSVRVRLAGNAWDYGQDLDVAYDDFSIE